MKYLRIKQYSALTIKNARVVLFVASLENARVRRAYPAVDRSLDRSGRWD